MTSLVVHKYGGTSVANSERIFAVASNICQSYKNGNQLVVVVSAMGQHTDQLLELAYSLHPSPPRRELDMLLSTGERISIALLSIALDKMGLPSVSFTGSQCGILTDETHGNARIQEITGGRIKTALSQGKVVIVAGFQGVSPVTKEITTLGRGGSDLSAIALAVSLGASHCEIYKDVPGVMTANPRIVKSARIIPRLSWQTMQNMAWSGAEVLHNRAAHLAHKFKLPIKVLSSLDLSQTGTLIEGQIKTMETPVIFGITCKDRQTKLRLKVADHSPSLWSKALAWLWEKEESPQSWRYYHFNSETIWEGIISNHQAQNFIEKIKQHCEVSTLLSLVNQSLISIIGIGFKQSPEILSKAIDVLGDQPHLIDLSDQTISICIKSEIANEIIEKLHGELLQD